MNMQKSIEDNGYRQSMGQLLMLYTQVDRLIMEVCAQRLTDAPDEDAELSLAKQVGDESRHVSIQRQWMRQFGAAPTPLITPEQEQMIREYFQSLPWIDFLADLYICVEALGSEAVERIVPLADPGTRESLRIPLRMSWITSRSASRGSSRSWHSFPKRSARRFWKRCPRASRRSRTPSTVSVFPCVACSRPSARITTGCASCWKNARRN